MTLFNWHNDPSKSGTAVNVDNLNEDLMYLKDTTDSLTNQAGNLDSQVSDLQSQINTKVNGAGLTLWKGTQAEYDALYPIYDPNTIYYVTE